MTDPARRVTVLDLAAAKRDRRPCTMVTAYDWPTGQLADAAGIITSGDDRNLDSAIFRLRRKIEKEASQPSPLKTVHGLGYQVSKPVEIINS